MLLVDARRAMKRHLLLLAVALCGAQTSVWTERFREHVFEFWTSDDADVWRVANSSDTTGLDLKDNLLALDLDQNASHALYFNKIPKMNTEDAQLSVYITVLGCNSLVQLFWKGRVVLESKDCPDTMWLPMQFSSYLTQFDDIDLMLLVTGRSTARPLLFSRLEVQLVATRQPSNTAQPRLATLQQDYVVVEDSASAAAGPVAWPGGVAFLCLAAATAL